MTIKQEALENLSLEYLNASALATANKKEWISARDNLHVDYHTANYLYFQYEKSEKEAKELYLKLNGFKP